MSKARDELPTAFEWPNAILTYLLMLQLLECAEMILFDLSKYIRTLQHKG